MLWLRTETRKRQVVSIKRKAVGQKEGRKGGGGDGGKVGELNKHGDD